MRRWISGVVALVVVLALGSSLAIGQELQPGHEPHEWPIYRALPPHAPETLPHPPCATEKDMRQLSQAWLVWRIDDSVAQDANEAADDARTANDKAQLRVRNAEIDRDIAYARYVQSKANLAGAPGSPGGDKHFELQTAVNIAFDAYEQATRAYAAIQTLADRASAALAYALDAQKHALDAEFKDGVYFNKILRRLMARNCGQPITGYMPGPNPGPGPLVDGPAGPPPEPPPPPPEPAVCPKCRFLAEQIQDVDAKIASWRRQIASLRKADVTDPGIQRALKEIDQDIAALKAKKARLEDELEACKKACEEAASSDTSQEQSGVLGQHVIDQTAMSPGPVTPPPRAAPNRKAGDDDRPADRP